MTDPSLLADWAPCRTYWRGPEVWIDWCYLGDRRFTDPFFEQTIGSCLREPFRLLFRHQTPIGILSRLNRLQPGLAPSGFIFHMSRCGSTLVSQLLASLDEHLVISEASPLDFVLSAGRPDGSPSPSERGEWIRALVAVLGRPRHDAQHGYFIKWDSWHTPLLPFVLELFPDTPWIFVYRDPLEVLASHQRQPGIQRVPGGIDPRLLDLHPTELQSLSLDEYLTRVLEKICSAALTASGRGRALFINYNQLPQVFATRIAPHFKVDLDPARLSRLEKTASRDAKSPSFPFQGDSARKQQEATPEARRLAFEVLRPLYEQLEAVRLLQEKTGTQHASKV